MNCTRIVIGHFVTVMGYIPTSGTSLIVLISSLVGFIILMYQTKMISPILLICFYKDNPYIKSDFVINKLDFEFWRKLYFQNAQLKIFAIAIVCKDK